MPSRGGGKIELFQLAKYGRSLSYNSPTCYFSKHDRSHYTRRHTARAPMVVAIHDSNSHTPGFKLQTVRRSSQLLLRAGTSTSELVKPDDA